MTAMELVGLNTKWYRYQNKFTQEQFANKTKFKMAYISTIENGDANLTCRNIDNIAKTFNIKVSLLLTRKQQGYRRNYLACSICITNKFFVF